VSERNAVLLEHGYHSLRVKHVVPETSDASSFVLDIPHDLQATFRYRPGQFCTFRVRIDGEELLRSYSMSSAPETDGDLTVTIKRVPGGLVSNWLLDTISDGDAIEATKPSGVFCPRESTGPVLGFCGGSGITPIMSITKHVLVSTSRPLKMLYANRDPASVIFDYDLTELCARHSDRLTVCHHFDSEGGFLSPERIRSFVGAEREADFYICGPGPFMDLVETTLHQLGVQGDRIFIERFLVEQSEKQAAAAVPQAEAAEEIPDVVTVIFGGTAKVIAYQPGDTLLETARRGGLRPPFSCESGNCATCMAFLKEGAATMRVNNALTPEEVEEGWILTCQALPRGQTVTVEYEAM
jgi:ferredoxin-NADP reductase